MRNLIGTLTVILAAGAAPSYAHAETYYVQCAGNAGGVEVYQTNIFEVDGAGWNRDRVEAEFKAAAARAYGVTLEFANCSGGRDRDIMESANHIGKQTRIVNWKPAGAR